MVRFPEKTFIENVNVSFLTKKEAVSLLKQIPVDVASSSKITLNHRSKKYSFLPSKLGLYTQVAKSVNRAFNKTYGSSYIKRIFKPQEDILTVYLNLGIDEEKFYSALIDISEEIDVPSVEAKCILGRYERYTIKPEKIGEKLEFAQTLSKLKAALDKGDRETDLVVTTLVPRVLAKDLKPYPPIHLLSEYTTYYGRHDSRNRIHNIKLVSELIDNTILLSGETYSLLEATGEFSRLRGFKEAFVIIEKELVPEYGGGSCQIATTLYNTVLLADLEILKRHNHGVYFNIYPLGRDAAIYADSIDFQFKNNTGHPILLKAKASDRGLSFRIYGTPTGKSVSFSKPEIYYKDENGTKVTTTETKVLADLHKPFSTKVIRTVKSRGRIIKRETIRSYYRLAGDKSIPRRRPEPE